MNQLTSESKAIRRILRETLALFSLPEPMLISDWADEYLWTPRGKFTCYPFQREMMDSALDPNVAKVVLMAPSQVVGKTETLNVVLMYHMHRDPCTMLMVQPTVEMGESWSKEKLANNLRATPVLQALIKEKSRVSGNTILRKEFPGGDLAIVGANSPAGLAMRDRRIVILDEVDRYPASAGEEGDPVTLAEKRTETYADAIKYNSSTPTVKGISRIEKAYEESDKRQFLVPCPLCGFMQALKWSRQASVDAPRVYCVRWPKGKPEEARYHCESCNEGWTDEQRVAAIRDTRAKWEATAPFKGIRGYHLSGLYSLREPQKSFKSGLHQFAAKFLEAESAGESVLRAWTNTFLAECWEEKGKDKDHLAIMKRCHNYPILPAKALFWLCAVDTQEDRLELKKTAFGMGEESWGISYEILMGNTEHDAVWEALFESISMRYPHPNVEGLDHKVNRCAICLIDSSYRPRQVLKFAKRCQIRGAIDGGRVYAIKGSNTAWDPNLISRPTKSVREHATFFRVGTDHAKATVFERLDIEEPGPRYMHFPIGHGFDEEYFKTLTAERLVLHFKDNILEKREWKKKRDRNEGLDIEVYTLAALERLKPAWDVLAKNLEVAGKSSSNIPNELDKSGESKESKAPATSPHPGSSKRFVPRRFGRFGRF